MINEYAVHKFCKDEISKIENYDKAIADTTQTWDCHHRDEIRELPSGMIAFRSKQELKENGRYDQCSANELIFLTHSEHMRLHTKYKNLGKTFTHEHRQKMSKAHKGKTFTVEHRMKLSNRRIYGS